MSREACSAERNGLCRGNPDLPRDGGTRLRPGYPSQQPCLQRDRTPAGHDCSAGSPGPGCQQGARPSVLPVGDGSRHRTPALPGFPRVSGANWWLPSLAQTAVSACAAGTWTSDKAAFQLTQCSGMSKLICSQTGPWSWTPNPSVATPGLAKLPCITVRDLRAPALGCLECPLPG